MASGDRTVTLLRVGIERAVPIIANVEWQLSVEDKVGVQQPSRGGVTRVQLAATVGAFNAMTGSQIRTTAAAGVSADPNVPERDFVV